MARRPLETLAGVVVGFVLCVRSVMADPIPVPDASCPPPGTPAARLLGFAAKTDVAGVRLYWVTRAEEDTDTFTVMRSSSAGGPFEVVSPEIPHAGTDSTGSEYEFLDSTGTNGHYYYLLEKETSGRQGPAGDIAAVDEVMLPVASGGEVAASGVNPNYQQSATSVPDALIICPDSWLSSLEPLRTHWNNFRQHATMLVALSQTGTTTSSIKNFILANQVQYVLLVGDSNIIPMWSGHDAPYGDATGDGLSDLALGRWPVNSTAEVGSCIEKSIEYDFQNPGQDWRRRWASFVGDLPGMLCDTTYTRTAASLLVSSPPTYVEFNQYWASAHRCCIAEREQIAVQSINYGIHLALLFSTYSNYQNMVRFIYDSPAAPCPSGPLWSWNVFNTERLEQNHMYTFYLGASCGLADVDGVDYVDCLGTVVRPYAEKFLVAENKGAIAWFGPHSSTTVQVDNYGISKEILSRITYGSHTSIGRICSDAIRAYVAATPEAASRCGTYMFLGDPTVVMAWDWSDTPTEAAGSGAVKAYSLEVRPNPGRTAFHFRIALMRHGDVTLSIYNVAGRRVRVLARGSFRAGTHDSQWDGRDEQGLGVAAGIYLVELRVPGKVLTQKLVLIR